MQLRALFPHRLRHRPLRARAGHPLPGPRLGRQFDGVLLPRHHVGRSGARRPAVRALHLGRAPRAARHRRRFRARAARRGHPVHLRQIRPRPRRHRRHGDRLSRPLRHPRGRQGLRPVGGHDRRAVVLDLGHGRRLGARERTHPRRHRRDQPAHDEDARAHRGDPIVPAPSLPARRRLRDDAQPARRGRAGDERRDGRSHPCRMGQGRSRRARHPQGRRARPRHAHLHPQGIRSGRAALWGCAGDTRGQ